MAGITLNPGTKQFVSIEFEIEGEKQVAAAIDFVADEVEDFSEPLRRTEKLLMETFQKNFSNAGQELGEKWPALSPTYARAKAKKYPGKGILERTGRMKGAFTSVVTPLSATIMNRTEYFAYHQSNQPRSKIPRRIMMKIDAKRKTEIFRFFTEFLNQVASHFVKK